MLSDVEIIAIERACERLVLEWAELNDRQDWAALSALFAETGIMTRPSGDSLHGRAAILESYQSKPGRLTRHICTNIRITVESDERAKGRTYAIVYSADANRLPEAHFGIAVDPRQLIGEFDDEFVRTPKGWRFALRRARFVMHVTRS